MWDLVWKTLKAKDWGVTQVVEHKGPSSVLPKKKKKIKQNNNLVNNNMKNVHIFYQPQFLFLTVSNFL
jgi:hypothetical protein